MPKSSGQKLKLLYLLDYLRRETDAEHPAAVGDIISYLDTVGISAERKSIYDDINRLCEYGYDIERAHDVRAGYYMASGSFEQAELKLLVDAVQSSKFITERKSRALIRKLESLTSRYNASALERQVFVMGRNKTENGAVVYSIDALHEAIAREKRITFKYFDINLKKEKVYRHSGALYEVSPWALIWDDENYYLVACDSASGEMRHYRVDKMAYIRITDKPRLGREKYNDLDMASLTKRTFGMFSGEDTRVTLECDVSLAGMIFDRFGTDVVTNDMGNGSFTVAVQVSLSPNFYSWVACFNGRMRVSAPESAVTGYTVFLEKALAAQRL